MGQFFLYSNEASSTLMADVLLDSGVMYLDPVDMPRFAPPEAGKVQRLMITDHISAELVDLVGYTGGTCSITRGAEATLAQNWKAGAHVCAPVTAGMAQSYWDRVNSMQGGGVFPGGAVRGTTRVGYIDTMGAATHSMPQYANAVDMEETLVVIAPNPSLITLPPSQGQQGMVIIVLSAGSGVFPAAVYLTPTVGETFIYSQPTPIRKILTPQSFNSIIFNNGEWTVAV